ncbi:hypothetical protein MRX96_041874 [Rhipicephalus microplus]
MGRVAITPFDVLAVSAALRQRWSYGFPLPEAEHAGGRHERKKATKTREAPRDGRACIMVQSVAARESRPRSHRTCHASDPSQSAIMMEDGEPPVAARLGLFATNAVS